MSRDLDKLIDEMMNLDWEGFMLLVYQELSPGELRGVAEHMAMQMGDPPPGPKQFETEKEERVFWKFYLLEMIHRKDLTKGMRECDWTN